MLTYTELDIAGYEYILEAKDPSRDFHAIFAIHNTALGPALGGTRVKNYDSKDDALNDVLRLSRGMSSKSAGAGVPFGGGKSIILLRPGQTKTPALLEAYAEALNSLQGRYFCAIDLGSTMQDMAKIAQHSPYVAGLDQNGRMVELSFFTAWGCFKGLQTAALFRWGSSDLTGKTIAIQGLGRVGRKLADHLFWTGAKLVVCDTNEEAVKSAVSDLGAIAKPVERFIEQPCDILSPCAVGGIISAAQVKKMQCEIVAGAANNPLLDHAAGEALYTHNILYTPDFIINSGGLIAAAQTHLQKNHFHSSARTQINLISERLMHVFTLSLEKELATNIIAEQEAEKIIRNSA